MSDSEKLPDWILWTWEHLPGVVMVCILIGTIVMGGVALVELCSSEFEERLSYAPPRSYTPPELASYVAGDFTSAHQNDRHLVYVPVLIESRDSSGGSGANFLVLWGSASDVDKPIIETVMVGSAGTQSLSLARSGIETTLQDAATRTMRP